MDRADYDPVATECADVLSCGISSRVSAADYADYADINEYTN